jgi:hypothetical protein
VNEQEAAELLERLGSREEVGSPPMGDLFRAGRQVRRSRHILQLAGVAAAVVVVTAGGFALQLQHDRDVPTASSTTPTVTKAGAGLVVPVGSRLVGEGDVVVAVPESWTTNDIVCGGVGSDTVTFNNDGPWATCAGGDSHASVLSVVDPASRQWDSRLRLTAKKVSVDGMSGLRTPTICTSVPDPTCTGVLTFPEEKVSFAVTSPDDMIVNEVLDSAERLPAGYVTVPDLEGMSAADARQAISAHGLLIDPPCTNGDNCTFYVRWPTTPPAGSAVAVGSTVSISRLRWAPPALPALYHGVSECGYSYLVQTENSTKTLGSCAEILPSEIPKPLVLTTGSVFYVRITHETNGQLGFPVPDSSSKAVTRTDRRGSIVQYRATSPGTAYLLARGTIFCQGIDHHRGTCPLLKVFVKAR